MICTHCAGEFYVQSHSPPSKVSTSFTCTGWCSDIQRWEKVILESWKQPFLRVNSQSWPAFPSKSAALRARHNMLNTKWFAQNSLKYSHSIPWDPLAPTAAHRRVGIEPCLYFTYVPWGKSRSPETQIHVKIITQILICTESKIIWFKSVVLWTSVKKNGHLNENLRQHWRRSSASASSAGR